MDTETNMYMKGKHVKMKAETKVTRLQAKITKASQTDSRKEPRTESLGQL